jgi:signal transduction histidine kinase/DNA-directed RNA polymerase subunit N (RpoN/RPB10)
MIQEQERVQKENNSELEKKLAAITRELDIQSSLEKMREATARMQRSEDLKEVNLVMLQQMQNSGITAAVCVIIIMNETNGSLQFNVANSRTQTISLFKGKINDNSVNQKMYENWKLKSKSFVIDMHGEELRNYRDYLKYLGVQIHSDTPASKRAFTMANFSKGIMGVASNEPLSSETINVLERFAHVFDGTYTRFLDLQKAEAQARESQIQLALERVRAKSLAMQHSSELQEVVNILAQQLHNMNIDMNGGVFICINKEVDKNAPLWAAAGVADYVQKVVVPNSVIPIISRLRDAIKKGNNFLQEEFSNKEKKEFFRNLFRHEPWSALSEERKKELLSRPGGYTRSVAVMQHTSIAMINHNGKRFSEDENEILKRFGNVFEQSYTRFLDLQKAEAQARESQIQLALERVRARTMAMQKSDELSETVFVLFQQFKELGENPDQATIGVMNEDEKVIEYWVTMYGQPINKVFKFPIDEPNVTNKIYKAWKENKKSLVINLTGKALTEFMAYRAGKGGAAVNRDEKRRTINVAFFSKGLLNVQSNEERSEESIKLLERFASVFEQTYTRFLDLQKAEAQAREAQIQLALERVRAKTMAMQKPCEFVDVINVIGEQFIHLGFDFDWVNFSANGLDVSKAIDIWNFVVVPGLYQGATRLVIPFFHHPVFTKAEESVNEYYTSGNNFTVVQLGKKDKDSFLDHLFTNTIYKDLPEEAKTSQYNQEVYQTSNVVLKDTWLSVGKYDATPLTDEQIAILKRLANEFGQAYTRFLDLQKAEAQARESQIQLALERVRARTMAMQKSDELKDATLVLFQQFRQLQQTPNQVSICIFDDEIKIGEMYVTLNGEKIDRSFTMELNKEIFVMKRARKAFIEKHENFSATLTGNELREYNQWRNAFVGAKRWDESDVALKESWYVQAAFFSKGMIGVSSDSPAPDETVKLLERFAKVFDSTYIRFNDLQKAESQAREAKIELGLERVRARAMAMQSSAELKEVVKTLFEELNHLDVNVQACLIATFDAATLDQRSWMIHLKTNEPYVLLIPYNEQPFYQEMLKAWKERNANWAYMLEGETKIKWEDFLFADTDFRLLPQLVKEEMQKPEKVFFAASYYTYGAIQSSSPSPFSKQSIDILQRFSKVFDSCYTRFLDLQKAEAQAREAQIELGLERVRARAMAMQKSDELKELIGTVFSELTKLDLVLTRCVIMIYDSKTLGITWWMANSEDPSNPMGLFVKYHTLPPHLAYIKAWKERELNWQYVLEGKIKKEWDDFLFVETELSYLPDFVIAGMKAPDRVYLNASFNSFGNLTLATLEPLSNEHADILLRFAKVFDLTYTRFNDLQKAEAQARESQIQLALERVRARTMAMQKSDDLKQVVCIVLEQLQQLDFVMEGGAAHIQIFDESSRQCIQWSADPLLKDAAEYKIPYNNNPVFADFLKAKNEGKDSFFFKYSFEEKNKWFDWAFVNTDFKKLPDHFKKILMECESYAHWAAFQKNSCIVVNNILGKMLSHDQTDILKRFAKVFEQGYIRFLDLQRAEAQAREAQIEAALERVRAQSMAMNKSQDLALVVSSVFNQLEKLGVKALRCGIGIINGTTRSNKAWITTSTNIGNTIELSGDESLSGHTLLDTIFTNWKAQKSFSYILEGNDLIDYYKAVGSTDFQGSFAKEVLSNSNVSHYYHCVMFPAGGLFTFSEIPFSEETYHVLQRFADAFYHAYKRFEDLQRAEAQAREAVKQAALDRIRADIASMRTVSDLDRITPLIWNELTILGVPFIRCGVFIMDDEQQQIHTFLSTPEGKGIAAFHLPYNTPGNIAHVISHWYKKEIYTDHWDKEAFKDFAENLVQQGAMKSSEQYLQTMPAGGFDLHFVPFQQGMLYVGNIAPLGAEEINLLQSIADAFSTAYARYQDFNKLEAAKKQVDNTLTELKQAQQQLVQSEKMASLGELTAGIAHEIQNPLNFVNNFSEVSNELIDEMNNELEKGEIEEAREIASDLKQNLEKINHHGKRADAIVKGMLQHSRKSTGQKEPTDINALADEYLRLSFHGLRAKDKNFNATIETDFDNSIRKINIIPQDIGRVLLNLFNNAFYAVNEQKNKNLISYEPKVFVRTQKCDGKIQISVRDNGNGIPKKILDKIFQPFFTTKPTGQGTGLGLSLSYDIIKAHGGEIKVESEEGEGSEFVIQLPNV